MLSLSHLHRRLLLHSVAIVAAVVVVLSSWLPQGFLLCLHHDGDVHVVSVHCHDDVAPSDECCSHDVNCVDVAFDLPEVQPHVQISVHAGLTTVTILSWSSHLDNHQNKCVVESRQHGQRQRDLGPPSACLIRTVRLQV